MNRYNLITILGPTASGKTLLAVHVAHQLKSGVISADSRQIYRGMDIGTGKDLADYVVNGEPVPYYLIDICDAGYQYNVFEYQRDFHMVFQQFLQQGKIPVLCGGSGLYLEAILKGYQLPEVPINPALREQLRNKSLEELAEILQRYKKLHNKTDIDTKNRAIRAIEIAVYEQEHAHELTKFPIPTSLNIGIYFERARLKERITQRLHKRLQEGLIDEVSQLLKNGLSPEALLYYGLEYKYVTLYLTRQLTYDEMVEKLNIAIHQFSKRQMTWFRRMERQGIKIHWIDGEETIDGKMHLIFQLLQQ
ncbi:MAG: tRNA (adenosine(37)-N6)-dimethylallyltransferase MiaA [Bacteroidales bacterium]|nr:tRNA (adenosine(37)-N6)-dimethylallyltransferase MiaA [Bacteroidales bacterium]HPO65178.1 tRNA (adenosine(37)-N6)-dimethylallyltransferase MiaA [Bacteroidales bacterium]